MHTHIFKLSGNKVRGILRVHGLNNQEESAKTKIFFAEDIWQFFMVYSLGFKKAC